MSQNQKCWASSSVLQDTGKSWGAGIGPLPGSGIRIREPPLWWRYYAYCTRLEARNEGWHNQPCHATYPGAHRSLTPAQRRARSPGDDPLARPDRRHARDLDDAALTHAAARRRRRSPVPPHTRYGPLLGAVRPELPGP